MRLGLFASVSLVLAALSGAMLADARPAPVAAPAPHLLLVPAGAEDALAATDPRVVARYESFVLVEAQGAAEERLRAAGAHRRDDMRRVQTAAGSLDPLGRASLAGKEAPDRDEVLALVQFVGPPKPAWLDRLRATGARVVTYQPENAYVVHAASGAVDRLAALVGADPAVRAVTPMTAADKVEGKAGATARYAVVSVAGEVGEEARREAAGAGPVVGPAATVGSLRMQYLELSPAEVDELASDPAVVVIERHALPRPHDERGAQIVAGALTAPGFAEPSGPGYLPWHDFLISGPSTFAIDVTDTGLDDGTLTPDHPDFYVDGSTSNPDRIDYQTDYTGDADLRDCIGHGTNVASIAAGYNAGSGAGLEDADGFNHGLGVAPRVQLGASQIFDCEGDAFAFAPATLTSSAYTNDARISNNSWGTGGFSFWGEYTSEAAQYDQLVRDAQSGTAGNQQMVEVFSAGNDGAIGGATIGAEGTAKNVITVGASEGVRASGTDGCGFPDTSADDARQVASFSSRGPTDDGRLKPDLVAPGTHVTGARPLHGGYNGEGTCNPIFVGTYSLVTGTSQAAPHVAGAAALVRQWYQDTEAATPSPALTKALLINTAADLVAGPDFDQGWGRVNLGNAFDTTAREYYDQSDLLTASGQTVARAFTVPDTSKPVKVTLVWTDAPGSPGGNAWANNLDLEVAGGGKRYLGNVFDGGLSRTGGAADIRNNVESVYLPAGTSGRLSVTVRGTNIAANGVPGNPSNPDQDFALVVSNAAETAPAPVLAHDETTVGGGDGDTALESDEQAQLSEVVRNAGDAAAGTPTATLTGGAGLTVTQGSSSYPTIAADGEQPNDTPFSVHLANAATCGADVTASLAVTDGSGTQTIPLVLPTGAPGAVQTNAAPAALAIPDNSAAGVSSSVFVGERGRIKDVDVAIPAIDHTFVGDLVIDLTGPDGTRVRLADHPGGPDNGGDDFTGTTFDDEAPTNVSAGSAPYTGSFKPQNDQLSRFDGKSRRGTWTLTVRDTFTDDVGTLMGWNLVTQKALCDVDTTPPDTVLGSGPAATTSSTSASFALGSNDGGATFECRLDGAAYEPCGTTAAFSGLSLGTHTFNARAIDGSDNEDPTPAGHTWTIAAEPPPPPPPPPAASFVLAPAEERLGEALEGRYRVLAACASACRASAKLTVSARTARRLGLCRRAVTLGSVTRSRRSAGTATASVPLTRAARRALRGRSLVEATLQVTVTEGAARLTLKRAVELRLAGGLRRIASRGLKLWAVCARSCPLSSELSVSAREARRIGLKPGTRARMLLASRTMTATRSPRVLTLAIRRAYRDELSRARQVATLLEAVAGTAPQPIRTAKLSKTLRR